VVPPERQSRTQFSEVASHDRAGATGDVHVELTSAVFDGLDITREFDAVLDQKLGETVLIYEASGLQAIGCHHRSRDEAAAACAT